MKLERELLGPAAGAAAVAGLVTAVVALVVGGAGALVAAVLGTVLVLACLLAGQVPVAVAARGRKNLGALLLLTGYATRVSLLLLAVLVVFNSSAIDRKPLGIAVIVCTLAWTAAAVRTFVRWKPVLIEPVERPAGEPVQERPE
ncbi:MAG: hypothetical protein ACXV2J_06740 [Actinomycetes bacterium]